MDFRTPLKKQTVLAVQQAVSLERYPSKEYATWKMWQREFTSVAQVKGWRKKQNLQVLAASLSGWAAEKIYAARDRCESSLEIIFKYLRGPLPP